MAEKPSDIPETKTVKLLWTYQPQESDEIYVQEGTLLTVKQVAFYLSRYVQFSISYISSPYRHDFLKPFYSYKTGYSSAHFENDMFL